MAESKKKWVTEGYTYGESIRRHAAVVAVFTIGGGFLGYYTRGFIEKHLGVEGRTAELIGAVGGAVGGFVIGAIVVSELDAAILETAAAVETEVLGCTRAELDAMSGEQRIAHLAKMTPEFVGPELGALLGPGLNELQGVIRSAMRQQPAPQPMPQWVAPQPPAPQPPAPAPAPQPTLAEQLGSLSPEQQAALGGQLLANAAKAKKAAAAAAGNGGNQP